MNLNSLACVSLVLILSAAGRSTIADEPVSLERSAKTTEDVLSRLNDQVAAADAKLTESEEAHSTSVSGAESEAVTSLKRIARKHISDGMLAKASDAWTEVLKIDGSDKEATAYFTAIGRPDILESLQTTNPRSTHAVRRIEFTCNSGRVFRKTRGNKWSDSEFPERVYRQSGKQNEIRLLNINDDQPHRFYDGVFLWFDQDEWRVGEFGRWTR